MSRDIASRDATLNVLTALTGCITAAALIGTGLATGLAADQTAQSAQGKEWAKAAAAGSMPKALPVRIVSTTRYIQALARAAQSQVSNGQAGATRPSRRTRAPAPAPFRAQAMPPASAPPPPAPSAAS